MDGHLGRGSPGLPLAARPRNISEWTLREGPS